MSYIPPGEAGNMQPTPGYTGRQPGQGAPLPGHRDPRPGNGNANKRPGRIKSLLRRLRGRSKQ